MLKFEAINWDDGWAELVDPFVEAWENDRSLDRLEAKYDRRYVESAECRFYAERIMDHLQNEFVKYRFAAHTDPMGWPPNAYWRIVVRSAKGKPIPDGELTNVKSAAKAVLENVRLTHPDIGAKELAKARRDSDEFLKLSSRRFELKVSAHNRPRGCVLTLIWPF